MNEAPAVAEHLKKLAQDYHDTHSALQARYRETSSTEDFLAELRQREAALANRFRLLQQHLLTALNEEELEALNRVVTMYLDFAEDQAKRHKQVFMRDWREKLDSFLQLN